MPENWDALKAFLACSTQWRVGPSGGYTGLDYAGCRAAVAGLGLRWRDVMGKLRIMEDETLAVLAERMERMRGR